jgi:hypothetical protein
LIEPLRMTEDKPMNQSAGMQLQHEFTVFLHRLIKAGWKVSRPASGQGKIVLTTPTGATINTQQPTSRPDFLDLRSKCVQMGLR